MKNPIVPALLILLAAHMPQMMSQESGANEKIVTLPDTIAKQTRFLNKDFLLHTPKEQQPKSGKSPLIVFLHGVGERGNNIEAVRGWGPPSSMKRDPEFRFFVVSPQCQQDKEGRGWWHPNDLNLLLDHVKEKYPVDKKRIYLTGLSMGGFGSWDWGASNPNTFAAIAPICGKGKTKAAAKFKNLPVWAFHGDKDNIVPLSGSKDMVDAINARDGKARLTIYPDVGHNSWTRTYANPKLYEWFLSHSAKYAIPPSPPLSPSPEIFFSVILALIAIIGGTYTLVRT